MRSLIIVLPFIVAPAFAQDEEGPNTLTPQQKADGWLLLFDGESSFGWKMDGPVRDENGVLIVGSGLKKSTASIPVVVGELTFEFLWESKQGLQVQLKSATPGWSLDVPISAAGRNGENNWHAEKLVIEREAGPARIDKVDTANVSGPLNRPGSFTEAKVTVGSVPAWLEISVAAGEPFRLRNVKFKPAGLQPIFDGKSLNGWREFSGPKYVSKFSVTPEGWLNVKNGPGDLQTERSFGDFLFQGECISNGDKLNSGVFFRCIPGYQLGYEFQIQNAYKDGDRRKPADFGTGAIYRRIAARKVVPNDRQWFAMTLLAAGNHIRTWVNGYPTVDWLDTRAADENPRTGSRVKPGHLSIQGHDPTTDLSFRNLRVVELPKP